MKKLVLMIFLLGFSRVFAAFEVDILSQIAVVNSFPILESKTIKVKGSTEARPDLSLQIGYQFPMSNSLKGISLLGDIGIEYATIGITYPGNNITVSKKTGLNISLGPTVKFVFGNVNSLVPRDTVLGFGVGAKIMAYAPNIIFSSIPPLTAYFEAFVEQRFFVSRSLAIVAGINVGFDYAIVQSADFGAVYNGFYVQGYPSLSIGFSVGLHFGK